MAVSAPPPSPTRTPSPRWPWAAGLTLAGGGGAGLAALALWARPPEVWAVWGALAAGWAGFALLFRAAGGAASAARWPWAALALGLGLRLALLPAAPVYEDDWHRYLWDGWRALAAGHPYDVPPAAFFGDETVPDALANALDGLNHPDYPTIYPPGAVALFALAAALAPGSLAVLKGVFLAAELALLAALWQTLGPRGRIGWALCPAVLFEGALNAHFDGLGGLLVLLALALAGGSGPRARWVAGLALGAAALLKLQAALAAPLLLRAGGWRAVAAAGLLGVAAYLPMWWQGSAGDLPVLLEFARHWQFNPLLHAAAAALLGDPGARALGLLAVLAAAGWGWARERDPVAGARTVFTVFLLASPVANPWYALWLLPLLLARPGAPFAWALLAALPLSYAHGGTLPGSGLAFFEVHPAATAAQWAALGLAAAWHLGRPHPGRSG